MAAKEFAGRVFNTGLKERDEYVRRHASSFYQAVVTEGSFTGIFLFGAHNLLGRPGRVIYLAEDRMDTPKDAEDINLARLDNFSRHLTDLTLSMMPTYFFDLYYCSSMASLDPAERITELEIDLIRRGYQRAEMLYLEELHQ